MLALRKQLFLSAGAATSHIYILDVVQKKEEMYFQMFILLLCLFTTHNVVARKAGCKMS